MRADKFFADKYASRTKAAEALSAGLILRGGKALKPSDEVSESDVFEFLPAEESFVSNGGYKLSRALREFSLDVTGKTFADLGASNGGFTDCLLQCGARRVYCVDVGESQLDERICGDPRVVVMDRTNARYLTREDFPERIDGVVSDLSFISLKLIFPAISSILSSGAFACVLVKPQFECENKNIGKSGIVARKHHPDILSFVFAAAAAERLAPVDIVNAPVREKKNVEYMLLLEKDGISLSEAELLRRAMTLAEER